MRAPSPQPERLSRAAWLLWILASIIGGAGLMTVGWGIVAGVSSTGATFRQPVGRADEFFDFRVHRGLAMTEFQVSWNPPMPGTTRSGDDLAAATSPAEVPSEFRALLCFHDPYRSYMGASWGVPLRCLTAVSGMPGPGTAVVPADKAWAIRWWALGADVLLHAAVVLLAAMVVRSLFSASRSRRRARRGLCVACAYDLASLPHASACPECGRPVAPRVG